MKSIPMCKLFMFTLTMSVLFFVQKSLAQDIGDQANDIKIILGKICSQDSVESVLATKKAFESEDKDLRSFVLEKALQCKDRRVRDIGFKYLVEKHKDFTVDIDISEKDLPKIDAADKSLNDNEKSKDLFKSKRLGLKIKEVNAQNDTFKGSSDLNDFVGSIGAGNITIKFTYFNVRTCTLVLKNYEDGYLTGNFGCNSYSFAAKAAMP